jgi:hypothetical protein
LLKNNNKNNQMISNLLLEFGKIYKIDNSIFIQLINELRSNYQEFNKILKENIGQNKDLKLQISKKNL